MEEAPPPTPQAPTRKLWACLLLPLVVTLVTWIVVLVLLRSGVGWQNYDALGYLMLPIAAGALAGLLGTPWFVILMRQRYRGIHLWLMGFAYPIGQIVLTGVAGFGACYAVVALGNH